MWRVIVIPTNIPTKFSLTWQVKLKLHGSPKVKEYSIHFRPKKKKNWPRRNKDLTKRIHYDIMLRFGSRLQSKRTQRSPPPMNTSKIHLHGNNSHWKLTGNWQTDSCTTKASRTIHTYLGRKGRKSGWGMFPWEGTQRKSEITQEDPSLGGEQFKPQIGCPHPGVLWRGGKPPWLVGGLLGLIEGLWEAWTPLRGVCLCRFAPKEELREVCWVSCNCLIKHSSTILANGPTLLTPCHSAALDVGWAWPGKRLDCEIQRWPGPWGRCAGGSHCWHLLKQLLKNSLDLWWWQLHHSSPPTLAEKPRIPHLPCRDVPQQGRGSRVHW